MTVFAGQQITADSTPQTYRPAILVLANGETFHGQAIGASGYRAGEVVFNTAMTGYQEMLTDPSYAEQILTLTYPHIGNVGVNALDNEASQIRAAGLVIRDLSLLASSWRAQMDLPSWLKQQGVIGIADIDTRRLTRILRENGAQNGCILAVEVGESPDVDFALAQAKSFSGLSNLDLAQVVSTPTSYTWQQPEWCLADNTYPEQTAAPYHVVAYDFGIKHNILRKFANRGCRVTVVPAQTLASEVLALQPDGVFLSNGPGDPAPCTYAIEAAKTLIAERIPLFGICLGMQIIALATGAKTLKMKFGHHGANHPVLDLAEQKVFITSQNHGFAVDEQSLPDFVSVTHRSLFDGSLQGIALQNAPVIAFQGHPEASPGPQDIDVLFDQFIDMLQH